MLRKLTLVLAGLLIVAAAAPVLAQSESMRINIPFSFSVGGKSLPAGEYIVSTQDGKAYSVSSHDGTAYMLTQSFESHRAMHPASLVFSHYGNQYSLLQVWTKEGHEGHAVMTHDWKNKTVLAKAQTVELRTSPAQGK